MQANRVMVPTGAAGDGMEIEPAGALIDENRLRARSLPCRRFA
jgi:hypothetical protein